MLLSNVVSRLICPGCRASPVGQTVRHVQRRIRERLGNKGTIKFHFEEYSGIDNKLPVSENEILSIWNKANKLHKLLTLEAFYIQETYFAHSHYLMLEMSTYST